MKLKFLQDIELETVVGLEEDGETPIIESDHFTIGEIIEDIQLDVNKSFHVASIQFPDGSVAFGVPSGSFDILD